MKRQSPFSKEFWVNKGYSEEEAEYKRNSIRPIKMEYWLERGYSTEQAIIKANETKKNNNVKGGKKSAQRSTEEIRKSSPRCSEYWLARGYSEQQSIEKVKEIQANNSLEKYVKRFGPIEGLNKWKERQIKWQKTLNSKDSDEIESINSKKNTIRLDHYKDIDDAIEKLSVKRNMKLFKTPDELANYIKEEAKSNPYILYMPFEKYYEERVSKIQKSIFESNGSNISPIKDLFTASDRFLMITGNKQAYRKWVSEGLLRSSYEIYFYDTIKKSFPDIRLSVDGKYPNSNMRYDFLIDDKIYVEICPMIRVDEKYRLKMERKKQLFDCVLLTSIEEIDNFIEECGFESDSQANN